MRRLTWAAPNGDRRTVFHPRLTRGSRRSAGCDTVRIMVIDIYFDLVCPWCYIGKHRLERALASRPQFRPAIRWQPFQLNPGMPRGGDRQSVVEGTSVAVRVG